MLHQMDTSMRNRVFFYPCLPDADEMPLHFRTIEVSGRQLMADGEALHELAGYERGVDDGGAYDAAL